MTRPRYHDLAPGDFGSQLEPYAFVELKYDGLYAEFVGNADGWSIHGRNGRLIRYGKTGVTDCYMQGEYISDTEWAEQSRYRGHFIGWNCIYDGDKAPDDYLSQRRALVRIMGQLPRFCQAQDQITEPIIRAGWLWKTGVLKECYEGLIFRSADGQRYGRMKRVVTKDYVVTGYREKGPCITALYGGLYTGVGLETVVTVPVKAAAEQRALAASRESPVGRVFEAKGNAILQSGALRHPRQAGKDGSVKWRTDKRGEECRL
jgi:hypothetical protein